MRPDYPVEALLAGLVLFAGVGTLLSLLICRSLCAVRPDLSRRSVIATVGIAVPVLLVLGIGLIELATSGAFSLAFVLTMELEAWAFFLAAEAAALLVARGLAPAPRVKVDPATFE